MVGVGSKATANRASPMARAVVVFLGYVERESCSGILVIV